MKGTVFQKPFEFNLVTEGESWRQGAEIAGTLTVKNHSNEPLSLEGVEVHLAEGLVRKVHARAADAYDILNTFAAPAGQVPAGQSMSFPWKFQTTRNAMVTYTTDSLFLVYGHGRATEKLGHLQLSIQPTFELEEFLKTIQVSFRFVLKILKTTSKGWLEAKLAPPDGKAMSRIEYLMLSMRYVDDDIEFKFLFNTKKVEATALSLNVAKDKKTFESRLTRAEYLVPSGRINHDKFEALINEALAYGGAKD